MNNTNIKEFKVKTTDYPDFYFSHVTTQHEKVITCKLDGNFYIITLRVNEQ